MAEPNGYSRRRSERNLQRKGSSLYNESEEPLAKEDADLLQRVQALREASQASGAARYADRKARVSRDEDRAGSRLDVASRGTYQRKARPVLDEGEEQTGKRGSNVRERKRFGQREHVQDRETSFQQSKHSPSYLAPSHTGRTAAPEASEDDEELPTSTAPSMTPAQALSAVTVRRQASRERIRELREFAQRGATDKMELATTEDKSAEAAFGELSWASLVSLVLWKNVSRSTLVFGLGTFFILASSNMREVQTSPLTLVANFLLLYTAFNFVLTFSRRHDPSPAMAPVTEASVLAAVRVALPFLTCTRAVHAQLFNGDTTTTLQVAVCLWVLAQCGGFFTFWDVARIAFFSAFLLPRVYLAYAEQIQAAGRSLYQRCRQLLLSFPHKRKLAAMCALGGWHWLSLPTKCFLGFVLLVLLRRYQEGHAQQVDAGVNFMKKQAQRLSSTTPNTKKTAVRRATLEEID